MEKMELLEEKIRKAAETIRSLREEREVMQEQLRSTRDEVKRLSLRKDDTELRARVEHLQNERRTLAERVDKMINLIEEAEAS